MKGKATMETINQLIKQIMPLDAALIEQAQQKMDGKTKPLGSLGQLETVAARLAAIQQTLTPQVVDTLVLVFAADHGIAAEGVSAFPAAVTAQMVLNFVAGGAAVNVLSRLAGVKMQVVDAGVDYDFGGLVGLVHGKVRRSSRNMLYENALAPAELTQALELGARVFLEQRCQQGCQAVALGEMGIGNTTSATAIICAASRQGPELLAGRGTGISNSVLEHKVDVIRRVLAARAPDPGNGLDILAKVGGLEIAAIVGAILAAAAHRTAVVLDGVISCAAGLVACLPAPVPAPSPFCGHRSIEQAQHQALAIMGVTPLLDLGMRLGEGTGAVLAIPVLRASAGLLTEMASFAEAGVSGKSGD
jgi:nicotinate-nucleotide--dimethylbenzimidazole phosphoribosyltransferase